MASSDSHISKIVLQEEVRDGNVKTGMAQIVSATASELDFS